MTRQEVFEAMERFAGSIPAWAEVLGELAQGVDSTKRRVAEILPEKGAAEQKLEDLEKTRDGEG